MPIRILAVGTVGQNITLNKIIFYIARTFCVIYLLLFIPRQLFVQGRFERSDQRLVTPPEHPSSPPVFSGVAQS